MKVNYSLSAAYKGKCPIQFGWNLKSGFYRKSTGIVIEPKYWNVKTRRVSKHCTDQLEHNRLLDLYQKRMNDLYYDSLTNGYEISAKLIDSKVFGAVGTKVAYTDFKGYIRHIMDERTEDPLFKAHTIKKYRTLLYAIEDYEAINGVLMFDDLTESFFNDFRVFLTTLRKINNATMGKYMSNLRAFLRQAARLKLPVPDDFKDLKIKDYKAYHIYLNNDELMQLYRHKYGSDRLLNAVRLFIMGSFTGMRFGDVYKLRLENIQKINGRDMIYLQQEKTAGDPVIIPVHPIVRDILSEGMPRKLSNQKLNAYIKEAARAAGITKKVVHYFNQSGLDVSEVVDKCDLISTHTARRSLITNMVLDGVPTHLVMKISGHRTEAAFRRYLCMDNELSAVMLAEYDFFKEKVI